MINHRIIMDNDRIRLSILFQFYRAAYNGKSYGEREENIELKDIPSHVIDANYAYLMDKRLINGEKNYTTDGVVCSTSDITAWGVDVVESIVNKSLDEIEGEQEKIEQIKKSDDSSEKITKLYEFCDKYGPACETIIKIANTIFSGL